ncbi:Protein CBG28085 [Caenorhabditis briggsae]|uniref:Protein CBG28085 n=1 Tax=Caenorhabditis briggsae TaxID=6238 RepID=B6IGS4_CAEBR|nr:Protein CBG28085 [Caenorhabditis briggsae]CAR99104.1 Protein CBG28085 [Caenorhabditis briggsae]
MPPFIYVVPEILSDEEPDDDFQEPVDEIRNDEITQEERNTKKGIF